MLSSQKVTKCRLSQEVLATFSMEVLATLARFHAQSLRPFSYYAPRFKMFQTLGASKQCISQLLDVNGAYDATWKDQLQLAAFCQVQR